MFTAAPRLDAPSVNSVTKRMVRVVVVLKNVAPLRVTVTRAKIVEAAFVRRHNLPCTVVQRKVVPAVLLVKIPSTNGALVPRKQRASLLVTATRDKTATTVSV